MCRYARESILTYWQVLLRAEEILLRDPYQLPRANQNLPEFARRKEKACEHYHCEIREGTGLVSQCILGGKQAAGRTSGLDS